MEEDNRGAPLMRRRLAGAIARSPERHTQPCPGAILGAVYAASVILAFPAQHQDIRPLAMGVARQVASARSWSLPSRSACLAAGKWGRSTAKPCFAMTNASPLMARQPKRSTQGEGLGWQAPGAARGA
jgi:hypothetical protein